MQDSEGLWQQLLAHQREIALIGSIQSVLAWDERTGMPSRGADWRAEQLAYLAGRAHAMKTSPEMGEWLDRLAQSSQGEDPYSDRGTTLRRLKHDFDKQRKVPQRLVEELGRAEVLGQQAWVEARRKNDYAAFQPFLDTNLRLRREWADAVGWKESRYDALLDDYEPGETTSRVRQVLRELREALVPLISAIAESSRRPDESCLRGAFPIETQRVLGQRVASAIGFDFDRGRLDETDHPFCTEAGPHDHRILTRYDITHFSQAFYGTLHEAGHGIYDQGLRPEQYGLPPGSFVSLGIHESQSRLWENMVGRSRSFWEFFFPQVQAAFPATLASVEQESFYRAVNAVRPSLIRVEADEATYNLHIIIRFELEEALILGELPLADLPSAWNEKYEKYLGLTPARDSEGVLQDVHWSAALFGYFPTYALGNLYAAHFFAAASRDLGDLDSMFRRGEFEPLRNWMGQRIHQQGRRYEARELLQRVGDESLSPAPLLAYLKRKLGPIYGLDESLRQISGGV